MLGNVVTWSKSWTETINRLAFGTCLILSVFWINPIGREVFDGAVNDNPISFSSLTMMIIFLLVSFVAGGLIVDLGSARIGDVYSPASRIKRAVRVGATQNALLARELADANQNAGLASGLLGFLFSILPCGLVSLLITGLPQTSNARPAASSSPENWRIAVAALLGLLIAKLIVWSAQRSLKAIDVGLDEIEKGAAQ